MSHEERQPAWNQPKIRGYKYQRDGLMIDADALHRGGQRVVAVFRNDEGRLIEASVPHNGYLRMINPAGNVMCVAIRTARVPSAAQSAYEHRIRRTKLKRGWLYYDVPPDPWQVGGREIKKEEWSTVREEIISERKAIYNEQSKQFAKTFKDNEKSMADAFKQAFVEATQEVKRGPGRPRKDADG